VAQTCILSLSDSIIPTVAVILLEEGKNAQFSNNPPRVPSAVCLWEKARADHALQEWSL